MLTSPSRLDDILRAIPRRYRLPETLLSSLSSKGIAATDLAIAIEHARQRVVRGAAPDAACKHRFIQALMQLIHDALRQRDGDTAFQAMVLRHRAAAVQEFESLSRAMEQDRRIVRAAVNAIAHPARRSPIATAPELDALAQLYQAAMSGSWSKLANLAEHLDIKPSGVEESIFIRSRTCLRDGASLQRLLRLQTLTADADVRRYQSLRNLSRPASGSAAAATLGSASRQRGAAVEALAARAVQALAARLNAAERSFRSYQVVTSMRVPSAMPGDPDRAKAEWDVALLSRDERSRSQAWDLCLLVEAKASVEAAATDLPRLLRGLRLLEAAQSHVTYRFATHQGETLLRGESLRMLSSETASLSTTVLYCCDDPGQATPRLLGAASRMRLLSARASLGYAAALASGLRPDPGMLERVWHALTTSRHWASVLNQYPTLCQARDLMVNTSDLMEAIKMMNIGD